MGEEGMKYRCTMAILTLIILPLYAQNSYPDSAVVIGYTRDWAATGEASSNRVSVRDSQSWIHTVFSYRWANPYGDSAEIYYVYSTDNGLTWSEMMNVSQTDSAVSIEPTLAIDSQDNLHCIWKQYDSDSLSYDLYYSIYDGTSWSKQQNITQQYAVPNVAHYPSMVIDSQDRLHVVYDAPFGYYNVFYISYDGVSWSEPLNLSNVPWDAAFPCITIDYDDNLHVVWRERHSNDPIMYSHYDGVFWTEPEAIASIPGGQSTAPCIVVNSQGYPRVIWHCGNVYYTAFNGVTWSKPLNLSNTVESSAYASMAVDSWDNLYVVWSEKTAVMNREIYYRTYNGSTWSDIINLSQDSVYSGCPKLGNPITADCLDLVWVSDNTYPKLYVFYMKLSLLGVEGERNSSVRFSTLQTFPNPFKNIVTIDYNLTISFPTKITIYDALGRVIYTINQSVHQAGIQRIVWRPKELPIGIYFVSLEGGDYSVVKKIVKIK